MQKVPKLRIRRVVPRGQRICIVGSKFTVGPRDKRRQSFRALYTPTSGKDNNNNNNNNKDIGQQQGRGGDSLLLFWLLLQITGINFNHLLN
ncbi:hypothetical protein ACLKA7_010568 [Drosophila subpalustris]